MKIAIIGPGILPIPPKGWGAIETLIWKYTEQLRANGHVVQIFNTRNLQNIANEINKTNFDFIHLQFDDHIKFFTKKLKQPFCVTMHNGYILKPKKWKPSYYSIFKDSLCSPGIISLSERIINIYKKENYKGFIELLKNGTHVSDFQFNNIGNKKVICVGKIEPRKRQAILAKELDGKINIDFVGPINDPEFKAGKTTQYLGVWDRRKIFEKLTEYSCLILFSDSEAAPLVTIEAMAAGLSIVVSEAASANLPKKEFIKIIPDDENDFYKIINILNDSIANNDHFREEIRKIAINEFDDNVIINQYIEIIKKFKIYSQSVNYKNYNYLKKTQKIKKFRYFFSRKYFLLNHFKFLKIYQFFNLKK